MNRFPSVLVTAATILVLSSSQVWAVSTLLGAAPTGSTGGGYILMIHATYEPSPDELVDGVSTGLDELDYGISGLLIAPGSILAPGTGGHVVFHAIPYSTVTAHPVIVDDPQLEVVGAGSGRRVFLQPNVSPEREEVCRVETGWKNHEGPIEACTAYKAPVHEFNDVKVVTLTLHFVDAKGSKEVVHSQPAHNLLHAAILGAPINLRAVDATMTQPSPFIIESVLDAEGQSPCRCAAHRQAPMRHA